MRTRFRRIERDNRVLALWWLCIRRNLIASLISRLTVQGGVLGSIPGSSRNCNYIFPLEITRWQSWVWKLVEWHPLASESMLSRCSSSSLRSCRITVLSVHESDGKVGAPEFAPKLMHYNRYRADDQLRLTAMVEIGQKEGQSGSHRLFHLCKRRDLCSTVDSAK